MTVIQITHNDLDGYGASAIARCATTVSKTIHVTRYKDVVQTFQALAAETMESTLPTTVLMTDIGIERDTAEALAAGAALLSQKGHRVVIIDHHQSSVQKLAAVARQDGMRFSAPGLEAIVDTSRCATSLAYEHAALYAGTGFNDPLCEELCALVNAADLWLTQDPHFMRSMALNDAFWDMVSTYIPSNHSKHESFVTSILFDLAALSRDGGSAADIEDGVNAARLKAIDAVAGADPTRSVTSRLRLAHLVARDREGFAATSVGGTRALVTFAMDMGIFQRVSEIILEDAGVDLIVNVMRSGGLSLRSRQGQALAVAKSYSGGGHLNSCGGDLGIGKCFSLEEALAAFAQREAARGGPQGAMDA